MIPVNLIPAGRRVARSSRRHIRNWAIAGGCWVAVLLLSCTWMRVVWAHADDADLSDQLAEAQERLQTAQARDRIAVAELKAAERTLETARLAADRPDWTQLLNLLSNYRGDGIQIEAIDLAGGLAPEEPPGAAGKPAKPGKKPAAVVLREKYDLKLSGIARSTQDAADFVVKLERTEAFTRVVIAETASRDVQGIPMTSFRIDCELADKARSSAGHSAGATTDASGKGGTP
jgi:Tfp pilus assembly protein PilN